MKASKKIDFTKLESGIEQVKKELSSDFDYADGEMPGYVVDEYECRINMIKAYNEFIEKFTPETDVPDGFPLWWTVHKFTVSMLDQLSAINY